MEHKTYDAKKMPLEKDTPTSESVHVDAPSQDKKKKKKKTVEWMNERMKDK